MATEVSYIIITPYSLLKSRTGGIIARLMSRTDLEFIGAQMLAFTREMAISPPKPASCFPIMCWRIFRRGRTAARSGR